MAATKVLAETYRRAAIEHVGAAQDLWEAGHYALAQYASGLAVECVLRAYITLERVTFDDRHDLTRLYQSARFDRIVPDRRVEEVSAAFTTVLTSWHNGQRFYDSKLLRSFFHKNGLDKGIRGDTVKALTYETLDSANMLVTLGDLGWARMVKEAR